MLSAASKGRTAAFDIKTTSCIGGKSGLGLKNLNWVSSSIFYQRAELETKGEYYKEPQLAKEFVKAYEIP